MIERIIVLSGKLKGVVKCERGGDGIMFCEFASRETRDIAVAYDDMIILHESKLSGEKFAMGVPTAKNIAIAIMDGGEIVAYGKCGNGKSAAELAVFAENARKYDAERENAVGVANSCDFDKKSAKQNSIDTVINKNDIDNGVLQSVKEKSADDLENHDIAEKPKNESNTNAINENNEHESMASVNENMTLNNRCSHQNIDNGDIESDNAKTSDNTAKENVKKSIDLAEIGNETDKKETISIEINQTESFINNKRTEETDKENCVSDVNMYTANKFNYSDTISNETVNNSNVDEKPINIKDLNNGEKALSDTFDKTVPQNMYDSDAFNCGEVCEEMLNTRFKDDGKSGGQPFYKRISKQLKELFDTYPRDTELEDLVHESAWVRIPFGDDEYYVVGVISESENPIFICYGLPRDIRDNPCPELTKHAEWLPIDRDDVGGRGYWVMYQDAVSGENF